MTPDEFAQHLSNRLFFGQVRRDQNGPATEFTWSHYCGDTTWCSSVYVATEELTDKRYAEALLECIVRQFKHAALELYRDTASPAYKSRWCPGYRRYV